MKALTLVLCILALLGSAASGYFWWEIGNTKVELRKKLDDETTRATGLQTDLTQTKGTLDQKLTQLAETDAALGDAKRSLTAAEARNVQLARDSDALKRTLATKEENERKLNSDLDQLRRELVQTRLATQVGSPEEIERLKQTISGLEARISELQGSPAAGGPTAAAPGTPAKPVLSDRTAAAKVATVGAKNAFVILELGTEDGIKVGDKFDIARDGEVVAKSVISEVKDTFAIAQVVPSSIKTALKAGDIASYQK